jgi:caa(3)-type oxidase subunit IV
MENHLENGKSTSVRNYFFVFITLAVITAVEIFLTTLSISSQMKSLIFIALSLVKAGFVASYFMHLRSDSKLYTAILILPALLFILFAYLTVAS